LNRVYLSALVFLVSLALTQFGSNFYIPFGFVSVIWPVTGIVVALYFIYGRAVLFGFFSSLLIGYFFNEQYSQLPEYHIFSLALINTSILIVAKALAHKCALPVKSYNPFEIIKFLMLTGPVASIFPAFLFVVVLNQELNFSADIFTYMVVTKWLGDTISIVFLTPILLFVTHNIYAKKGKRPLASIITTLVVLTTIFSIHFLISNNQLKEQKRHFKVSTQPFIDQARFSKVVINEHLKGLTGLVLASEEVDKQEFERFASSIYVADIHLRALGWLPRVNHAQRSAFEQNLVTQQLSTTGIKQLSNQGLVAAAPQQEYYPIKYLSPYEPNKAAIGLDVLTHPVVSGSIKQAIANQESVITPMLSLAQQLDKYTGVIVYSPVYKSTVTSSGESLIGFVEVVFELEKLLNNVYENTNSKTDYGFAFSYGENNRYNNKTYKEHSLFHYTASMLLFDKQAHLTFSSTKSFEEGLINWQSLMVMVIACVIGVICVMFVFFIVSFNASLRKRIDTSTKQLQLKNKDLTIANKAKNLFLANISHEYRTPLNAIIGFTEIAQREVQDKRALDYFDKIESSSVILLNIVNDVLDTSKIQSGELTLEALPFCPAQATCTVIEMLRDKAQEKSITIQANLSESFEQWVKGDEVRFKQILINLINNAIKFTPQGKIVITGDAKELDSSTHLLTISVEDNGIGIDLDTQKRLFKPFAQAEDSTARKYGGTGLGLAIVKQLCLLMGGDIELESEPEQGARFVIKLRLASSKPANEAIEKSEVLEQKRTFEDIKILVVEDNKINQLVVKKQLDSFSIQCHLADDGEQALAYLAKEKPDLILMDLQMPNMDGFTVSKVIKNDPGLNAIPIVILSASVGNSEKQKAKELAIEDFIHKPFSQADLQTILAKYFC